MKINIKNTGTPINTQDWIVYDDPNTAYDAEIYYGSPYEYGDKPKTEVKITVPNGK